MCSDGKSETYIHAARIKFHSRVDELLDLREGDYLVKLLIDLGALHAEDRPVEINVLTPGEFRMKAGAHFEQRGDAPMHIGVTFSGFGDARKNFQQRALPCSVAPDHPDDLAAFDLEGNILQRPKCFGLWFVAIATGKMFHRAKRRQSHFVDFLSDISIGELLRSDAVALAEAFDFDGDIRHIRDQWSEIRNHQLGQM